MNLKLFALLFVICAKECVASRILVLFPSPSRSHLVVMQGLTTALAERGHHVTVVSPFPLDKKMENYRDIKIEIVDEYKEFVQSMVNEPGKSENILKQFPTLMKVCLKIGNDTLNMPQMRYLMNKETFDLVITGFFLNNYMLGIADHFKCPSIMFSSIGPMTSLNKIVGNPLAVSSTKHFLQSSELDFFGRVKNFLLHGVDHILYMYIHKMQKEIYDFHFPSKKYISYDEAHKNISLIFVNSHTSQGNIRPNVPGIVEVGGIQIKSTPSPLPENLQRFMDEAEDGVILFSLGSNAKSSYLSKAKIDVLLKVFSKLKQRVIMKWETDELEGKSNNVFTGKWLPQDDILAHPKTKLFISHCGLGSVVESKYHGVPIVGMPIFGDQMINVDLIVKEGWGLKVDFGSMDEDSLLSAIEEVLSNPKYSEKVKYLSDLYRDRPLSAKETAIYWVEYVIKHKGAPHLRYSGADLNFLQYNSLDVIAFITFIIVTVLTISIKIFNFLIALIFCNKQQNIVPKKSKKSKKSNKKTK